jgi:hypothetical protein
LSACRPEGQKGHGNAKEATEATEKRARSCKLLEFGGKKKGIGDSKRAWLGEEEEVRLRVLRGSGYYCIVTI